MKNKMAILMGVLVLLLVGTGFIVYKVLVPSKSATEVAKDEDVVETLPPADASIKVDVSKSKAKDNTVVMKVSGLGGKIVSVAYELTYDSEGLIKGVNSGSKPIETDGKDDFEREVYLGTCSRNVCKPDAGVKKISVVMEFTDKEHKKSQFTKDYDF